MSNTFEKIEANRKEEAEDLQKKHKEPCILDKWKSDCWDITKGTLAAAFVYLLAYALYILIKKWILGKVQNCESNSNE